MKGKLKRLLVMVMSVILLASTVSADVLAANTATSNVIEAPDVRSSEEAVNKDEAADGITEQTLEGSAGSVAVTIEGRLPEGTRVKVASANTEAVQDAIRAALESEGLTPVEINAVDIKLIKDGKELEKPGNVTVKLDNLFDRSIPGDVARVYHVSGSSASVVSDADPEASGVKFTTNHFSIYVAVKAVDNGGLMTLDEKEEIAVTIHKGEKTEEGTIGIGKIEDNRPIIDGYTFVEARYGNAGIDEIFAQEINGKNVYFVSGSSNSLTAIEVKGTEKIELFYEPTVNNYKVTYEVKVDGKKPSAVDDVAEIVGAYSVKSGNSLEFAVTPKLGYSIDSVIVGSQNLTVSKGKYVVKSKDINGDFTVSINLSEVKSYNFSFYESSNTTLKYGEKTYISKQNKEENFSYSVGKKISFSLEPNTQWDEGEKELNRLSITLNDEKIAIVPPTKSGESLTQNFSNGVKVKITKTNEKINYSSNRKTTLLGYKYQVEISGASGENLHGDIKVSANFKSKNSSEIWARELVGVEPIYVIGTGNSQYTEKTLEPLKDDFWTREDTTKITKVYIKVQNGYSSENLTVKVRIDGEEKDYSNKLEKADRKDYDYYFTIEKNSNTFKPTDIRISVIAQKKTYKIKYDPDNGDAPVIVDKAYKLGDNFVVTDGKTELPTKEGYVFQGWEIDGTTYTPGALYSISEETPNELNQADGKYVCTFKAKWVSASQAVNIPYTIEVYFAKNGSYDGVTPLRFTEFGSANGTAYIVSANLRAMVESRKDELPESWKWDDYTEDSGTERFGIIAPDGSTVIKIYYKDIELNDVYAYVKFEGLDETNENEAISYFGLDAKLKWEDSDGVWFPIGKIPDVEIAAATGGATADANAALNNWGKITDLKVRDGNLSDIRKEVADTWSLHASNGANSFTGVDNGAPCWHLDGTINLNRIVKVEYIDEDGIKLSMDESISSAVFKTVTPTNAVQKSIEGYEFKGAYIGEKNNKNKSITFEDDSVTITLVYAKIMEKTQYTVRHVAVLGNAETQKDSKTYEGTAWVNDNPRMITVEADSLNQNDYSSEGYQYEGTYVDGRKLGEDEALSEVPTGTVITLKYVAKANLDYEVSYHYSDDGTNEVAGSPLKVSGKGTLGEKIPYDVGSYQEYNGNHYILDTREGKGVELGTSKGIISAIMGNNTVDVYYVLDNNRNNTPDYKEHRVYYVANGGTGTFEDTNSYAAGALVKAAAEKAFTKTGYEFAYWKSSEEDAIINADKEFTMPDKDVTLTAQWRGLSVEKTVVSTPPEEQNSYAEGDTINFEITVANIGDVDLTDVVVSDGLNDAVIDAGESYTVDGNTAKITSLAAKSDSVTVKAHYVVTADDLGNAEFKNRATAAAGDSYSVTDETGSIPLEGTEENLTITKTIVKVSDDPEAAPKGATGEKGGKPAFRTGDTAEFLITVENTGEKTLNNITLTEQLLGAELEKSNVVVNSIMKLFTGVSKTDGIITITKLGPGKSKTFKATYLVPEDVMGTNDTKNIVIAEVNGKEFPGKSEPIPVEDKESKFTLVKAVSGTANGKDGKYVPGDELTYTITISNTGNTALKEFRVKDTMTASEDGESSDITSRIVNPTVAVTDKEGNTVSTAKLEWANGVFEVSEIPVDGSAVISYTYAVQQDDAGKTINNAAVAGTGDDEKEEKPKDSVVVEKRALEVTKEITDINGTKVTANELKENKYKVGDIIHYTVTVENTGNVTLEGIEVTDTMNDNRAAVLAEGESSTIGSLAVNAKKELHYSYTIKEEDLGKTISNNAKAEGDDAESNEPETPGVEVEKKNQAVTISKSITSTGSAEGGKYKVGEAVSYKIVVTNTGNTALKNVRVKDIMRNASGTISKIKLNGEDASGIWNESTKEFTITAIARGSAVEITYDYVVQPKDRDGGKIDNEATVENTDIHTDTTVNPNPADVERKSLDVAKTVISRPSVDDSYQLGDEIKFMVTVKNDGNVSLSDIAVTDEMQNAASEAKYNAAETQGDSRNALSTVGITENNGIVTLGKLGVNETVYLYYTYKVDENDIGNTDMLYNKVTVDPKDDPKDDPRVDPKVEKETDPLPIAEIEPGYAVTKSVTREGFLNDGAIYAVGDTIRYKITVKNTGNVALSQVPVRDEMEGASGSITNVNGAVWDAANKKFTISDIAIDGTAEVTYEYVVRKEDMGKTITNKAIGGEQETGDNPVVIENRVLKVEKTVLDSNGDPMTEEQLEKKRYKVGEVVNFAVTVTNDGNVAIEDIAVADRMWAGLSEGSLEGGSRAAKLANESDSEPFTLGAGDSKTLRYQYTVAEGDLGYKLFNQATAWGAQNESAWDIAGPIIVEDADPKLSVVKSIISTPNTETGMYKVGDTITYQIAVKNEGNTTLKKVEVKDIMTGASGKINGTGVEGATYKGSVVKGNDTEYTFVIDEIPRQGEKIITYSYKVVPDDIGKSIRNTAVADGVPNKENPENPAPIDIENRKLEVTKTVVNGPKDGKSYQLGETIEFEVTVKNAGNVDLTGIKLTDTMVGTEGRNATVGTGNVITGIALKAGDTYKQTFKYTVQEADLKAPGDADAIKNTVTAVASDGTEGYGETEFLKIGEMKPDFTIAKVIDVTRGGGSAENGKYAVGDTIYYQITVTNNGNTTLKKVEVKDIMTGATGSIGNVQGATWREQMGSFIVDGPIPVGGSATITYEYEVQSEDAGNTIRNTAVGKPWSDAVTETEIEKRELSVSKERVNAPANGTGYVMGEEVLFRVTVENTGNVSLSGITVTDVMQNSAGQAVPVTVNDEGETAPLNGDHTIDSLSAGESAVVYYSYTVQEGDIGRTDISNTVTAVAEGSNTTEDDDTTDTDEVDVPVDGLHTLTVHYVYAANGMAAAEDHIEQLAAGADYLVYSPVVEGYSSAAFVTGTMHGGDFELIVYYTAIPEAPETPETPGTTPTGGGGGGDVTPTPPTPTEPPVITIPPAPVPAGVIQVTVPADLTPIDDEAVPLQGARIDIDDDGNVTVTTIGEDEIPLAGGILDMHVCCILSFLLMLATLIIYTWYTYDMKKRQKKLILLRNELEEESLKRQFGITNNR